MSSHPSLRARPGPTRGTERIVMVTCRVTACPVPTGGRCVEGFADPAQCPNFASDGPPSESIVDSESPSRSESVDAPAPKKEVTASVDLPRGEALTEDEAEIITRAAPTRVIVIAGAE